MADGGSGSGGAEEKRLAQSNCLGSLRMATKILRLFHSRLAPRRRRKRTPPAEVEMEEDVGVAMAHRGGRSDGRKKGLRGQVETIKAVAVQQHPRSSIRECDVVRSIHRKREEGEREEKGREGRTDGGGGREGTLLTALSLSLSLSLSLPSPLPENVALHEREGGQHNGRRATTEGRGRKEEREGGGGALGERRTRKRRRKRRRSKSPKEPRETKLICM